MFRREREFVSQIPKEKMYSFIERMNAIQETSLTSSTSQSKKYLHMKPKLFFGTRYAETAKHYNFEQGTSLAGQEEFSFPSENFETDALGNAISSVYSVCQAMRQLLTEKHFWLKVQGAKPPSPTLSPPPQPCYITVNVCGCFPEILENLRIFFTFFCFCMHQFQKKRGHKIYKVNQIHLL